MNIREIICESEEPEISKRELILRKRQRVRDFINTMNSRYPETHPMFGPDKHLKIISSNDFVQFTLQPDDAENSVEISWISAHPQRKGYASAFIKEMQDLATDYKVDLTLTAWANGRVEQKNLIKIYEKSGFKMIPNTNKLKWKNPETEI